jgi:hypothetical protein
MLGEGLDSCASTVITGRAGMGKTLLAKDFARTCGRRTTWYTVEASDGELRVFFRYLVEIQTYPNAIYYASQDVGLAQIARSDNGGLTFGVAIPMYTLVQCGGIHGHIKVAPDGTVYVPNKSCNGEQGVAVSEDNGLTWNIRTVPGSTPGDSDPSVGVGADGTVYLAYADGDGRARVAVSHDRGLTWVNVTDVGAAHNLKNSVFPAAVAGDANRAAVFFLGSSTEGANGRADDMTFDGTWFGYIATTYDGGQTWVTVNATPGDPVQRGVVCTVGTPAPARRATCSTSTT